MLRTLLNNLLLVWQGMFADRKVVPFYILGLLVSGGLIVIFDGVGWYLLLYPAGFFLGLPILDLDKYLAPKLELPENFFHRFNIYLLLFVLAVFVITATGSIFGQGMVVAMLIHGWLALSDFKERRIGLGLLGVALLLLIV